MLKALLVVSALMAGFGGDVPKLGVTVNGLKDGERIADKNAFCVPDAKKHTRDGGNISPKISWEKGPEGTRSYVVIMHDPDVPTKFDDANKEDKTISARIRRRDFYHWVLVDIPEEVTSIAGGAESKGVNKKGKPAGKQKYGVRGVNDFGSFMKGAFGGYDGPCPPWNDERLHHYHFTVYALDIPTLALEGNFTANDALKAMKGHVLAKGEVVGTFSQNPKVNQPKQTEAKSLEKKTEKAEQ